MKLLKCPFTLLAMCIAVLFLFAGCAAFEEAGFSVEGSLLTPSGTRITIDENKRVGVDIDANGQVPGAAEIVPE